MYVVVQIVVGLGILLEGVTVVLVAYILIVIKDRSLAARIGFSLAQLILVAGTVALYVYLFRSMAGGEIEPLTVLLINLPFVIVRIALDDLLAIYILKIPGRYFPISPKPPDP